MANQTFYDENTKIWSGIKAEPRYGPQCSIGQVALDKLMSNPDHIAQICYHNDKKYTNREIATLSIRVAEHFRTMSIQQRDIIGICASNSDFVAPLFFGAMLCGLTVSTLDPSLDKDGIKHIFSITKPKLMFCDGAIYRNVKECFEELQLDAIIYTMKDHIENVPEITEFLQETDQESEFRMEPLKFGYLQTAAILCSSGVSGLPKGVCMSHASLLNENMARLNRDAKILCFSTLYWLSGVVNLIRGTTEGVTRVITDNAFNPELFFNIVEKYKINFVATPPPYLAMSAASPKIADFDLSSIQVWVCGGCAIPYVLIEKIKAYLPNTTIVTRYGMSEMAGVVSGGVILPNGSSGQLTQNNQIKVIDRNGQLLEAGQLGELCMRSLYPWSGYYGNPQATENTYKDGWIHSGDLGYIDQNGHLFVVDRIKDIFKYNGFHVYPTEIETVIQEMEGVAEVCVFGLPDIVATHLPAAAIVKASGSSLTAASVSQYVAGKMAHFKHLHGGVYFMDKLPKTTSGKIIRREVTLICSDLHLQSDICGIPDFFADNAVQTNSRL